MLVDEDGVSRSCRGVQELGGGLEGGGGEHFLDVQVAVGVPGGADRQVAEAIAVDAEAFRRDIETFVAADAVADFSRADHDMALAWIARTCGVPLATDRLLEILQ